MTTQYLVESDRAVSVLRASPRAPILLENASENAFGNVSDDPRAVLAMVPRFAPYWPVMRYAAAESELEAMIGDSVRYSVEPWFRGGWADDIGLEQVVDILLEARRPGHARFSPQRSSPRHRVHRSPEAALSDALPEWLGVSAGIASAMHRASPLEGLLT